MTELVEAVARAISCVPMWDGETVGHNCTREELNAMAQAAIAAARPAILEEAAKVAELEKNPVYYVIAAARDGDDRPGTHNDACADIATAIRAIARGEG